MRGEGRKLLAATLLLIVSSGLLYAVPVAYADSLQTAAPQLAQLDASIENPASPPGKSTLTPADNKFLDDLESRGIRFFMDEADPVTGLMPDRARANGGPGEIASTASIGFGLTALCVGDYRGYISHQVAYDRSLKVLLYLRDHAPQLHGLFYHFLNMHTGAREWNCEVSNIDTALLMGGVITVRQHFPGTELAKVADQLYQNVDWGWLSYSDGTFYMGYRPEVGILRARWGDFNEGPLIYLLALGSRIHPVSAQAWEAWRRQPVETFSGLTYVQCPPLFTHQYPQVWFDLRGLRDNQMDYFRNSQLATLAQRQWFIDDLSKLFPLYGPNLWGLTASDCEGGYTAWGGPPLDKGEHPIDGSVVPAASAGSLAFEPRLCLNTLENMRSRYGQKAWAKYGFVDCFNPSNDWYDHDVIGIDVGPSVLMAENCRSGFVWKTFMSAPEAQAAIRAAGFRPYNSSEIPPTTSLFSQNSAAQNGG
jgi:hypothetical protein